MDFIFLLIIVALLLFMLLKCHPAPCESDRIVHLIDELREHEGAYVQISCDNPEPETRQDQACVTVCDDWTDWQERTFYAETVLAALQAAKFQRDCSATIETVMTEQGKTRVPAHQFDANCSLESCPDYLECLHANRCKMPKK